MSSVRTNAAQRTLRHAPNRRFDEDRPAQHPWIRVVDLCGATAGLVLLAPLWILCAVLILIEDGRPVLFRQQRVGRYGNIFFILKFRTMRDASRGRSITAAGDPRVTCVGSWLRRLKLDELPQFINILRGEMSLIGPRPEVPEYVESNHTLWRRVLAFRPGITDLASLAWRNEEDILARAADPEVFYRQVILPDKLMLNLQYQGARSLRRDVNLLWLSARYSFFPRGFDRIRIVRSLGFRSYDGAPVGAGIPRKGIGTPL